MKQIPVSLEALTDAITSLQWAAMVLEIPLDRECTFNDSRRALEDAIESAKEVK